MTNILLDLNLKNLTVREIIGQLIMPRIDFSETNCFEKAKKFVRDLKVGGFIVFNAEIEQLRQITSELQSTSKFPLFFGCDAERGLGQIVEGCTRFPFFMSQGAINDPELLEKQAELTAQEMKYCGLNILFAPVLDVNLNSKNPIINIRSLGYDADMVSRLGRIFVKAVQRNAVLACGKHFPGHGDCEVDSHVSLPIVDKSKRDLEYNDLKPFVKAVDENLSSIMLAHILYPEIDKKFPATCSKLIIKEILRKDLSFDGLVITDSFRMGALNKLGKEPDLAFKSIESGCDIILDPKFTESLVYSLERKYESEKEFSNSANHSVDRIFGFKSLLLSNKPISELDKKFYSESLVREICERSVCLVKGSDFGFSDSSVNVFDAACLGRDIAKPFLKCLNDAGVKVLSVNYFGNTINHEIPEMKSPSINLVFTTVSAWNKFLFLSKDQISALKQIERSDYPKALVSLGSPYILSDFKNFDKIVCSFGHFEQCQTAVAEVVLGVKNSKAKLPINLFKGIN